MKFKQLILTLSASACAILTHAQCNAPTASTYLNINNVSVQLNNGGDMWWDLIGSPLYEFPAGSGKHPFFSSSIWIGGKGTGDSLKLAAVKYRQGGAEFYAGPLTNQGTVNPSYCNLFDNIIRITKAEIDDFINNGTTSYAILNWPAKGNATNNMPMLNLAPFHDANNDDIYNPNDGDFPLIKGDVATYTVYNDVGGFHHETGATAIGIEVHQMAYAYAGNGVINNSIFYDYTITKKTAGDLTETYFGNFIDPDLGNPQDDYIASSSSKQLGMVYNSTANDTSTGGALGYGINPPAAAVKFLRTPELADGSMIPMSSLIALNNTTGPTGTPTLAPEYYNLLSGMWGDGAPVVLGGTGRVSSSPAGAPAYPFMFDLDAPSEWTECSASLSPGDRRFIMSVGPFTLEQNKPVHFSTVSYSLFPTKVNSFSCDSLNEMYNAADTLQQFYLNNVLADSSDSTLGFASIQQQNLIADVYPNPSTGSFSIQTQSDDLVSIAVHDLSGRRIAIWKDAHPNQVFKLESSGIYLLQIQQLDKSTIKRLVIH